jgi:tetratricopeptide (TPR) repeat protein/uncharacterized caspase-like protein
MNLLGRTTVVAAILLHACTEASFGNGADPATSLLSSLSSTVTERSVLVEGSLPYSPGIDIWNVVVNDSAVFAVEAAKKGGSVPLRLVIALRDGNNTIGIDGLKKASDRPVSVRHWRTHVYVKSDQEANRFAILLKGESHSATDGDIEAVRAQLVESGIADENIAVPKTRSELEDAFAKVRAKAGSKDKVLVYFRGRGALSTTEGEPILLVSSEPSSTDGWLPVSELAREAIGLPPVSYALDVNFQSGSADPFARRLSGTSDTVQQQNPDQRAFGWVHAIVPERGWEILLSNPFGNGPPGGLTHQILSRMSVRPENGCTTLTDIGLSVSSSASNSQGAPEAVYFAGDRSYSSFCLSPSNTSTQQLTVNVSRYPYPDPFMLIGKIDAAVPAGITGFWREVAVDSVIVRHAFASDSYDLIGNRVVELVSLTEGQHLVELRLGVGSKIVASGRTTFEMPSPGLEVRSESEDLGAEILRPATRKSVTSSGFFTVGFIVADKKVDSVRYEMRNNGVVILRGIAGGHKAGQNVEILRRIPVSVGENIIVIEVRRDKETRSARCLVTRRVEQPLRAVLVGADHVEGLNQLNGVRADVESMKRVLLNYTDVKPKNLITLVGSNATGTAVREALFSSSVTHPSDPMIQGGGEETVLLYFSGYGTTLLDSTRKPTARCILPADFEPGDAAKRCISTVEVTQMLDVWNSAIVIFDTSYDGLSGTSRHDPIRGFLSRTFGDYLSPDVEWRASSGTDRGNRVFLVGSKTNTAALESAVPPQGLFTGSLVEAIAERAGATRSDSTQGAQLFDVFASARTKTIAKSGKSQIPLIKGSLASPFYFKLRSAEDLATEARAIDLGILDDIQSLRKVDANDLERAESLYDTVLALHPDDFEAQQGKVRLLIYRGQFEFAEASVGSALDDQSSSEHSSPELSGWYLLRSVLKMRRGDISGALSDCEKAKEANAYSALVLSLLPKLYFAIGNYEKSAALTSELLDRAAELTPDLTDDEWAHVVLLGYIALKRSNNAIDSAAWLKRHFSSYAQERSVPAQVGHVLVYVPKAFVGRNQSSETIRIRSPWFQAAAEFLLEPEADGSTLLSFNEKNSTFDPKDPKSMEFMAYFYKGMKLLMAGSPETANNELRFAVQTDQKQFVEYWIAQAEINRIH